MRILHCSDLHADDAAFRWLIRESRHYDLVCITGDLLDVSPYHLPAGQIDRVVTHLGQITAPLTICSGNHDSFYGDDPRLIAASWLHELRRPEVWVDGDSFVLGGHRFRAFAWMDAVPALASTDEIWLMHAPPDLTPTGIVRGGVDFGDFALGEVCRSGHGPRLVLSGHVHDRQAWCAKVGRTWSFNPGCATCGGPPNHVVIELGRKDVAYLGTTSGESVHRRVMALD